MKIIKAAPGDKILWNKFVEENYPPVGAFMQTWEWADFKEASGRKVSRYLIKEGEHLVALFTLAEHALPFGLMYGYISRGPVMSKGISETESLALLKFIKSWVAENFSDYLFVRLEPPVHSFATNLTQHGFHLPSYYIQPRHNHVINLAEEESAIMARFHSSTRSNLNRAERRGVTTDVKFHPAEESYQHFCELGKDTIARNSGKNVYPAKPYFDALFRAIPVYSGKHDPENLTIATFYGYVNGELAAIHFVLFFGETATYLYGASSTKHLSSKVTTYLHWQAMRESKRAGMKHYDLGGVDEKLWPSLTSFKRQFNGEEITYIGNIDIPLSPKLHRLYNLMQKIRK